MTDIQYGDNLRGYIKLEDTYGVPGAVAVGDGFKARTIALADADRRRDDPMDSRNTRSVLERAEARHAATWSVTVLLRLSGTAGTVCDIADLLELAFGTETTNIGTSVAYTQLSDRSDLSATIWGDLGDVVEFVRGCVCSNVSIKWGGNDWITLTFSGPGKEFGETGVGEADGIGTSTTTLVVADLDHFSEYSLVQVGADTNGGAGFYMTSLDHDNEAATLDDASSWASGAAVTAYMPTPTYTGSLIPFGTMVTTSIDGGSTTQKALGGELNIETGMGLLNEEEGGTSPTEPIMTGKWRISGKMDLVVRKTDVPTFSHARRQVQKDCKWTFGSNAGYIMTVDADQVEFDPSAKDIPDSGYVKISMPFEALGSTGEDNLTVTLT